MTEFLEIRNVIIYRGKKAGDIVEQAIREEVFSGFCRSYNRAQTVTCEFVQKEEGVELTEVDCGYRRCIHQSSCEIARQIHQMEEITIKESRGK